MMKVNSTGIGAIGLSVLLLTGCGGGDGGNADSDANPTPESSTGDFSSFAGGHTGGDLTGQNSGILMAVSPNGVLHMAYRTTSQSEQVIGIGQMTGSGSNFESTFDVYNSDTGNYFDTITIMGELASETNLKLDESSPKVTIQSNTISGTFATMKSLIAVESPPSIIPNKSWSTTEGSTSIVTNVQRDGSTLSLVDDLGCTYTGELTPSKGSPHFSSGDHLAFTPHAYEYRGTIQNCAADKFVGLVDLLTFSMPDGSENLYYMRFHIQSSNGIILATVE